jgi:CheY-like chemotaxis protein
MHVLLVEDNEAHARVIRRSLLTAGDGELDVARVSDGEAALDRLHGGGALPDLILLDMNLPVMQGLDVLRRIRSNAATRAIPVIVVSSREDDSYVNRCYEQGANAYVVKPADYQLLRRHMASLRQFWGGTTVLPDHDAR